MSESLTGSQGRGRLAGLPVRRHVGARRAHGEDRSHFHPNLMFSPFRRSARTRGRRRDRRDSEAPRRRRAALKCSTRKPTHSVVVLSPSRRCSPLADSGGPLRRPKRSGSHGLPKEPSPRSAALGPGAPGVCAFVTNASRTGFRKLRRFLSKRRLQGENAHSRTVVPASRGLPAGKTQRWCRSPSFTSCRRSVGGSGTSSTRREQLGQLYARTGVQPRHVEPDAIGPPPICPLRHEHARVGSVPDGPSVGLGLAQNALRTLAADALAMFAHPV